MNIKSRKILSFIVAMSMVSSMAVPAFGEEQCSKDEIVYVNLNHNGSVNDVYVVNAYCADEQKEVVDFGDYTSVRNLSTTEKLKIDNGQVNLNLPKGKFYYQGNLETKEIPWIVDISYKLDGEDINGSQLAGKSGYLEIFMSLKMNPDTNPIYTDNFALQSTVTLDSENCKNIVAEDATIANVGNNKQLSYIVLPDKEKDYTISADVVDFEMNGISVNGIPLTLNIDDPDTDDLMDDVYDLQDGAVELDDGAVKLDDGVVELCDGVVELHDGADDLYDGVDDLYDATKKLKDGADTLEDGFGQLESNSRAIKVGIYQTQEKCVDPINLALTKYLGQKPMQIPPVSDEKNPTTHELLVRGTLINKGFEDIFAGFSLKLGSAVIDGVEVTEEPESKEDTNEDTVVDNKDESNIVETKVDEPKTEEPVKVEEASVADVNDESATAKEETTEENAAEEKKDEVNSEVPAKETPESAVESGLDKPEEAEESKLEEKSAPKKAKADLPSPDELKDLLLSLNKVHQLSFGSLQYIAGTEKLSDGYGDMHSGVRKLNNGVKELYDGTNDLKDGVDTLYDGTLELKDGTVELTDGTFELRDETWDLDTRVDDEIDDMLDEYRNNDFDVVSFVDSKNTNVDSVQFVMKTEEITIDDEDDAPEQIEEDLGFWDRVKNLFSFLDK